MKARRIIVTDEKGSSYVFPCISDAVRHLNRARTTINRHACDGSKVMTAMGMVTIRPADGE